MIEEVLSLNVEGRSLDEVEARLVRAAEAMVSRIKDGLSGVSVGGAGGGPGSGTPSGASGGMGPSGGGAGGGSPGGGGGAGGPGLLGGGIAAALNGAAQGMGNLTPATVSSPTLVAQEAGLGAARGLATAAATGLGAVVGGALGSVIPGAGTLAGAAIGGAAGNALGTYVGKQFDALDEAVHKPSDVTAARLKSFVGDLAAHGVHVSDDFMKQQARYGISIERRRLQAERHTERLVKETGVQMGGVSWGISQIGR